MCNVSRFSVQPSTGASVRLLSGSFSLLQTPAGLSPSSAAEEAESRRHNQRRWRRSRAAGPSVPPVKALKNLSKTALEAEDGGLGVGRAENGGRHQDRLAPAWAWSLHHRRFLWQQRQTPPGRKRVESCWWQEEGRRAPGRPGILPAFAD